MNRLICWSMLLCGGIGLFVRADEAPNVKAEGKKMQGTWKPVTAELAGKPFPEEVLKSMKLVITDGKYAVTVGGQVDEGTVTLDTAKSPRTMEIVGTKGPNQGRTISAIYELKDNKLRVCYDLSGQVPPKEFKTKLDSKLFLVEYQREKP